MLGQTLDGVEANPFVERAAGRLTVVEAKAAQTAPSGFLKAARRMRDRLAEPGAGGRPCDAVIAYGGGEPQSRTGARPVPWTRLHEEPWADG